MSGLSLSKMIRSTTFSGQYLPLELRYSLKSVLRRYSHCDTCKILGGGAFTMNQIIPKDALKITKGGEPSKYTYYGDSGMFSS